MKKVLIFIILLLPWFLSSLIPLDYEFYNSLTLPFFAPGNLFFPIAWFITYFCITISIYQVLSKFNFKIKDIPKSYIKILIINYIFNQSFQPLFFLLKSPFLGFVSAILIFITTLFLYEETSKINEKSTKFLNPYVLLSLFATILSLTTYILNVK